VGSHLVDDLPVPMIKKLFHFYADSERRIKLMEDENAGYLVCSFKFTYPNLKAASVAKGGAFMQPVTNVL
jgi:hypothetical protein